VPVNPFEISAIVGQAFISKCGGLTDRASAAATLPLAHNPTFPLELKRPPAACAC